MIFLQALYGLILAERMGLSLDEDGEKVMARLLSVERRHRNLR